MERTIERSIGNAIRVLSNMIHREITNSPGMKLVERVTGTNAWIIGYIAQQGENDVFQRDLEQKFGITRSTASKVVNLMVQKGLIVREKVPGDARLKKLMLTNRSREMLDMMDKEFQILEDTLADGFTSEELDQFFGYIHRMQNNIKMREEKHL